MQNFENIEDLVTQMFERLDGDNPVSVVANKDLAVYIMQELLDYENVILDICDIDSFEYDREYLVSLFNDIDTYCWHISVEQIYDNEKDIYLGTDGYVLFHEDVNSKALVDMQNNKNVELSGYDWFVLDEDEETDYEDETETEDDDDFPTINGKRVSVDEYNAFVSKFAPDKVIKADDKPSTTSKEIFIVNDKRVDKETYEKEIAKFQYRCRDNIRDVLLKYADFMDDWNDLLRLFC